MYLQQCKVKLLVISEREWYTLNALQRSETRRGVTFYQESDSMTTSEKLIYLRKREGMTQEQLAEKIGVSRQALSKWESGDTLPETLNILSLSHLFSVSTDYLLNDEYESDKDLPQVKENDRLLNEKWWNIFRTATGIWLMVIPALAFFMMSIIASIIGYSMVDYTGESPKVYKGLRAMLHAEHLIWLFWLLVIMFIVGAVLIIVPMILKRIDKK